MSFEGNTPSKLGWSLLEQRGGGGTVHWIQDNFVFGQNSKSLLVFRNGLVRSFGIFYATFDEQNGDFFYSKC